MQMVEQEYIGPLCKQAWITAYYISSNSGVLRKYTSDCSESNTLTLVCNSPLPLIGLQSKFYFKLKKQSFSSDK